MPRFNRRASSLRFLTENVALQEHEFDSVCSPKFRREGDQTLSCLVDLCVNVYGYGRLRTQRGTVTGRLLVCGGEETGAAGGSTCCVREVAGHGRARQGTVGHVPTANSLPPSRYKWPGKDINKPPTPEVLHSRFCLHCSCADHTSCCCYPRWQTTAIMTRPSLIHATWFTKRRSISVQAFPLVSFSSSSSSPNSNIDVRQRHQSSFLGTLFVKENMALG